MRSLIQTSSSYITQEGDVLIGLGQHPHFARLLERMKS